MVKKSWAIGLSWIAAFGIFRALSASSEASAEAAKGLVAAKCAVCHKGKFPPRGLNLGPEAFPASVIDIPSRGKPDFKLVDTAAPETSYLLMKITGASGIAGRRMPPPGKPQLSEEEIRLLQDWMTGLKKKPT